MVADLVIKEGDLEVLRDRTRDISTRLQSVTVATAGDYISSAVGGASSRGRDAPPATRSTMQSWQCRAIWTISPSL